MFPVVLNRVCAAAGIRSTPPHRTVAGQQTFSSLQRFSIGFRPGDWLVHSRTIQCSLQSRAACLGSDPVMTCLQCSPWGKEVVAQNLVIRFSHPSILFSIWCSPPVPICRMLPPPCFTERAAKDKTKKKQNKNWSVLTRCSAGPLVYRLTNINSAQLKIREQDSVYLKL